MVTGDAQKTYQRILTYTLRTLINKVNQVLLLGVGPMITGQAILTPMLMVLVMVTGDVLAVASSADNGRPSPQPRVWRIGPLTIAAIIMGLCDLLFCVTCLAVGKYELGLGAIAFAELDGGVTRFHGPGSPLRHA